MFLPYSNRFSHFEDASREYPGSSAVRAVGICTGLIAAAAIASARSLSELLPVALEATKLSFRIGNLAASSGRDLTTDDANGSWSTIVTGISSREAQAALDHYYAGHVVHKSSRAYISAISTAGVTISGAPSSTKRLFLQSSTLSNYSRLAIPIFAPYHAEHLFSAIDIDRLFNEESTHALQQFATRGLVHSASTGKCFESTNALDLMRAVACDILLQPVRWDRLLEEAVSQVVSENHVDCTLMTLGVTNIANSFLSALKAGGLQSVRLIDHTSWGSEIHSSRGRPQNDKIAIVGMAGRFPNSANHDALWELLMQGLDVHKEIPNDRFDAQAHYDPSGKGRNKSHTPYGCFIDAPGLFDPRFFNMSPREAAQTDPMGRLALVTAYEALEMSGYVPNRTPSTQLHRIGTFYGQTSDDWREINAAENVDTYFITGGVRAFAPGRINYYFKQVLAQGHCLCTVD